MGTQRTFFCFCFFEAEIDVVQSTKPSTSLYSVVCPLLRRISSDHREMISAQLSSFGFPLFSSRKPNYTSITDNYFFLCFCCFRHR